MLSLRKGVWAQRSYSNSRGFCERRGFQWLDDVTRRQGFMFRIWKLCALLTLRSFFHIRAMYELDCLESHIHSYTIDSHATPRSTWYEMAPKLLSTIGWWRTKDGQSFVAKAPDWPMSNSSSDTDTFESERLSGMQIKLSRMSFWIPKQPFWRLEMVKIWIVLQFWLLVLLRFNCLHRFAP